MKFLFIVCALLLSGMARAQTSAQATVQTHVKNLVSPEIIPAEASAYSLGVVYGYYVQGLNSTRADITTLALSMQERLNINVMPSRDTAAYAVNQFESALTDLVFCLYRGIAHGNYLAGQNRGDIATAATANVDRFNRACNAKKKAVNNAPAS